MTPTRRSVLRSGAGALTLSALAGCLSAPGGRSTPEGGYAAFFTLWDWAEQVAGDEISFESAVEVGEMGHGWEPPAGLSREVAGSDVFVYMDTPEFSWAQDLVANLEGESEHPTFVDGMEGLEPYLLEVDAAVDEDREVADADEIDPETVEIREVDIYADRGEEPVMYWHDDHWHGGVPDVPLDGERTVEVIAEDAEGRVLPLGEDEPFQVDADVDDRAQEGIVDVESDGDRVTFVGLEEGRTRVYFEVRHDGETLWDSSEDLSAVTVAEDVGGEVPNFYDPHVWVDPVLAQHVVETIADGLVEIDPENEETYRTNAESYVEELEEVDRAFENLIADASRDVAVFAGHDSFQYLEHRYGFELHTPVGVSPDAVQSLDDISATIDVVEAHDIETILYDPFETPNPDDDVPRMVEVLLDNTDATEYAPLSPAEGTTEAWKANGYGWVEQMTEINVPSLEKALDAT